MTTNHIERLDPALIRPGRVDIQVEMREASLNRVASMASRIYENKTLESILVDITEHINDYELTMAEAQELMIANRNNYGGFLALLKGRNLKRQ